MEALHWTKTKTWDAISHALIIGALLAAASPIIGILLLLLSYLFGFDSSDSLSF